MLPHRWAPFKRQARFVALPCGVAEDTMTDEAKTLANWAKELGLNEKKLKEAVKLLGLEPDSKKGVCCYYGKASVTKAQKAIK